MHSIIDSDRVIVMDFGSVVEFDRPHVLLQNEDGIFHGMVRALGAQEFDRLSGIAIEQPKPWNNETKTFLERISWLDFDFFNFVFIGGIKRSNW